MNDNAIGREESVLSLDLRCTHPIRQRTLIRIPRRLLLALALLRIKVGRPRPTLASPCATISRRAGLASARLMHCKLACQSRRIPSLRSNAALGQRRNRAYAARQFAPGRLTTAFRTTSSRVRGAPWGETPRSRSSSAATCRSGPSRTALAKTTTTVCHARRAGGWLRPVASSWRWRAPRAPTQGWARRDRRSGPRRHG